nr:uncharacterized protein LOC104265727 isoform X2 [Ciona intestinalis]|eukprot:XP_026690384.1 uncharacterized protein LOC104265727 isoform X2 [Ciona intestinalis]
MILIVGDGNFSYSLSLAQKCTNVCATSYESYDLCQQKYGEEANKNMTELKRHGAIVLNGVDATKLHQNLSEFLPKKFEKIIFNFPHTGRKASIRKNRELLRNFFLSAKEVLDQWGKIEVTLCSGQGGTPFDTQRRETCNHWQIVGMAAYAGLVLNSVSHFNPDDYTGYTCTGRRNAGKEFGITGAITHTFVASDVLPVLHFKQDWKIYPTQAISIHHQVNSDDLQKFPSSVQARLNLLRNSNFLAQKQISNTINKKLNLNNDLPQNVLFKERDTLVQFSNLKISKSNYCSLNCVQYFCYVESSQSFMQFCDHPSLLCLSDEMQLGRFSFQCAVLSPVVNSFDKQGIFQHGCFQYHYVLMEKSNLQRNSSKEVLDAIASLFPKSNSRFSSEQISPKPKPKNDDLCKILKELKFSENLTKTITATCKPHNVVNLLIGQNPNGSKYGFGFQVHISDGNTFTSVSVIDMDTLCCILIPGLETLHTSVLWSLNKETQSRIKAACVGSVDYSPLSTFPQVYSFHVSFWLPNDEQTYKDRSHQIFTQLVEVLWNICDGALYSVRLTDVYTPTAPVPPLATLEHDHSDTRTSHCYEIKLKSYDFSLSQSDANTVENIVRKSLPGLINVVIR